MDVTSFKSSFTDMARPDKFRVRGLGFNSQDLEFMCKAAQIPASTLGVIEVPYQGRKIKLPGDRTYAEWTITVMNSTEWNVREYFEDWSNKINNPELNRGVPIINAIKEDAQVEQLDVAGLVIARYELSGCWPSEVSPIELGWETTDTAEEFTVTLAFDYFNRV